MYRKIIVTVNGYTFRGSHSVIFTSLPSGGQLLKERICSLGEFFSVKT